MNVCGVLLAAGAGSRFAADVDRTGHRAGHTAGRTAGHKLLALLGDRPMWRWSLDHLLDAGLDEVVVVTGAVALDLPPGVRVIDHPGWASGQASSLHAGLIAAADLGAEAAVIGLADQPFIAPEAWRAVAASPCDIAVATYDGERGPHPVRLARRVWPLVAASGDGGARDLIRLHPEWVCAVPCLGSAADIDTLEDLERWRSC